jgi:hypothetical protein
MEEVQRRLVRQMKNIRVTIDPFYYPYKMKDSHIKTCSDDGSLFLVAEQCGYSKPRDKSESKLCVLNALQNILPAPGVFRACGQEIPIVIYGFYYENSNLRMIIVLPEKQEVYDAFAFQEDLIHILLYQHNIKDTTRWTSPPGFQYFFIRHPQTNEYMPMSEVLTASAKNHKFNASLQNWLGAYTKNFLYQGKRDIPTLYQPFNMTISRYLYASPRLPRVLSRETCQSTACPCTSPRKWSDILETTSSEQLQQFMKPFLRSSQDFWHSIVPERKEQEVEAVNTKSSTRGRKKQRLEEKPCKLTSLLSGVSFHCVSSVHCKNKATHNWPQCCGKIPRVCELHSVQHQQCPIHETIGMSMKV